MKKRKLNTVEHAYVETFIILFNLEHGYVSIRDIDESKIYDHLMKDYIRRLSIDMQIELTYDWILSQNMAHVSM